MTDPDNPETGNAKSGNSGFCIILTSCAETAEAEGIARSLVELQLAACVNLLPGANSIYRWQGKIESSCETLLIIKSHIRHIAAVQDAVCSRHSYAVPEFLVLEIPMGSNSYLEWLSFNLK